MNFYISFRYSFVERFPIDIFKNRNVRKLILCLSILQPLNAKELQYFFPLLYTTLKQKKKRFPELDDVERKFNRIIERKKNHRINLTRYLYEPDYQTQREETIKLLKQGKTMAIKDTEKEFEAISIKDFSIFANKDLYYSKGVLKQAINAGLIKAVPSKKGRKQDYYYFLNSDLVFKVTKATDFRVSNLDKFFVKNVDSEKVSLMSHVFASEEDFFDIAKFLLAIQWIINYRDKLSEIWNKELSYNPFKGKLHKKSMEDGIIFRNGIKKVYKITPYFSSEEVIFRFSPSYNILNCFEKKIDYDKTPMQNLNEFIKENYKINPEKRVSKFISLEVMYEEKGKSNIYNNIALLRSPSSLSENLHLPSIFTNDYKIVNGIISSMENEIKKNIWYI